MSEIDKYPCPECKKFCVVVRKTTLTTFWDCVNPDCSRAQKAMTTKPHSEAVAKKIKEVTESLEQALAKQFSDEIAKDIDRDVMNDLFQANLGDVDYKNFFHEGPNINGRTYVKGAVKKALEDYLEQTKVPEAEYGISQDAIDELVAVSKDPGIYKTGEDTINYTFKIDYTGTTASGTTGWSSVFKDPWNGSSTTSATGSYAYPMSGTMTTTYTWDS